MRRLLLAAYLLLGTDAGCGPSRLIDQKLTHTDSEYLDRIFSSPIVVVGVILSDTLVRRPVPSHWDAQTLLQLRKLKIRVENVLRGDVIPGAATVYYFTWAGAFNGPRPLGFWVTGRATVSRRILWLRHDSGVLRTACDGWDYCTMPVGSGAHPQYKPDPKRPLAYALADIWFTRGEKTTDADFARQIDWGAPSTVPEAYLFEKLQQLAATEVPAVRTAACKQLSYYHQKCVEPRAKR